MKCGASELLREKARPASSRLPSVPEWGRRKRGQDRNAYRIGAEQRSGSPDSRLTSVAGLVPCLCSGHTIKVLKTALAEFALPAVRTHNTQSQSYHKTMKARRGYKRATIARYTSCGG